MGFNTYRDKGKVFISGMRPDINYTTVKGDVPLEDSVHARLLNFIVRYAGTRLDNKPEPGAACSAIQSQLAALAFLLPIAGMLAGID